MKTRIVFFFALVVCMPLRIAFSQTATGQITGTVTDPTGGVVPDAKVVVASLDSGFTREAFSSRDGYYVVPGLPPGNYQVTVEAKGFNIAKTSAMRLHVEQAIRLDFALEVGVVAQAITVQATAPLVQSTEGSLGQVIGNRQVLDLPLNGRQYNQLVLLSNGASEADPGTRAGVSGFSSNGQRPYQNNFMLDGLDNNSNALDYQGASVDVIRPNIDALQEFKVQTNAYSAEFGRGAGAVVNVALKSGSNEFHGTAFEFLRNDKIQANDFFNNSSGIPRPAFHQNQFGGTFGGPIKRDKVFFFLDYQGTLVRRPQTQAAIVPTAAERSGDFSQYSVGGAPVQIFDPATYDPATNTRTAFPGNIIPPDRIDPVAAKLVQTYPAPNVPGQVPNYFAASPRTTDTHQFDIRQDVQLGASTRLFARYSYQTLTDDIPPVLPPPAVGAIFGQGPFTFDTQAVAAGLDHTFSPTLLNQLRIGYTRLNTNRNTVNTHPLNQEFGINGTVPVQGLAELDISDFQSLGDPQFQPNQKVANTYEVRNDISWVRGKHTISIGGQIMQVQSSIFVARNTRGEFSFADSFTRQTSTLEGGSGLADLLLGIPTNSGVSTPSQAYYIRSPFAAYIQDSWRMTRRLTITAGVRYDLQPWYHERYGNIANLVLDGYMPNPPLVTPRSAGVPNGSLVDTNSLNFAPRLGFAYELSSKTVLRAGYGLFFGGEEQIGGGLMLHSNPPFLLSSNFSTDSVHPDILLGVGFPPGAVTTNPVRPSFVNFPEAFPTPYSQQWNFTFEQEISPNLVVSASYVGSTSTHLSSAFSANSPPPGPGNINSRRPIKEVDIPTVGTIPIGDITRVEPRGLANYHSLQLRAEKRMSSGLTFLTAYTLSKAIDDSYGGLDDTTSPPNNNADLAAERSRASFDVRHRLVFSYIYELPFGKGRHFLSAASPLVDGLVGGWQVEGLSTIRSGMPFSVTATGNLSNTESASRPNLVGNPRLSSGQQSIDHFFNTDAFQFQAPYTFGNAGRNILTGPDFVEFDFSVIKLVHIRERLSLQFRAEAFNVFNHPIFGFPGSTLGVGGFGVISSTAFPPRELQFGMKLVF
ncbi:MAG TPA: TonB-dependent receptor [Bryobacteraceae bacterium]|jgi:hypothetical protein